MLRNNYMNKDSIPRFNLIREISIYDKDFRYDFFAKKNMESNEKLTIHNLEKTEMELCNLAC